MVALGGQNFFHPKGGTFTNVPLSPYASEVTTIWHYINVYIIIIIIIQSHDYGFSTACHQVA